MSRLTIPLLIALGLALSACQTTTGSTAGAEARQQQVPSAENGWAGTHRYDRGR